MHIQTTTVARKWSLTFAAVATLAVVEAHAEAQSAEVRSAEETGSQETGAQPADAVAAAESPSDDARRVLLVGADETLVRAVRLALEPWDLWVVALDAATPGATMPRSARRGRALAGAQDAAAVVWISIDVAPDAHETSPGVALWVYDRRDDRAISRPLRAAPPYDPATAAQVALIVKTLLRQGPVWEPAGEPERPQAVPSPDPPLDVAPATHEHLSLEVGLGVRAGATVPLDAEPRIGLALTYWPEPVAHYLGLVVRADTGPGLPIAGPELRGRWTDTVVHLGARGRVRLGDLLDIGATLAIGVQLSTLDGVAGPGAQAVGRFFVDPHAIGDLEAGLQLDPRLRLGVRGGASVAILRQRYFAGAVEVLRTSPVSLRAAFVLEVGLL